MKLKIKVNSDKLISLAIMSSFFVLTFQYLILIYFDLINTSMGSQIQLVSKAIVGSFYLIALPFVLERNKVFFLGSYLISIFVFLFTYFLFPENTQYIWSNLFPHFFIALPSFIYAFSINDFRELKKVINKTGCGVFLIGTLIFILVFIGESSVGRYSMSLSYYMLMPLLIYTDKLFNKFAFFDLIVVIISIIIILGLGSRGALLCYTVFLFYRITFKKEKLNFKSLLKYLSGFFTTIILLLFHRLILKSIYNLLLDFDIRSRTLSLFMENGIHLSGREELYSIILNQISKNPILGVGLFGDRRFLGGYVHNIFLELWVQFGIIIGSSLIVLLLFIIYQIFIKIKEKSLIDMMSIWFSMGFVHLLVSSSYISDFRFFIFLGLSLNILNKKTNK
jgi:O-antigen ligase